MRSLLGRIDIADVGPSIETSPPQTLLSDTHIAAAVNVKTGRPSQGRVIVAAAIKKERINTDCCVVVAFGVAGKRTTPAAVLVLLTVMRYSASKRSAVFKFSLMLLKAHQSSDGCIIDPAASAGNIGSL